MLDATQESIGERLRTIKKSSTRNLLWVTGACSTARLARTRMKRDEEQNIIRNLAEEIEDHFVQRTFSLLNPEKTKCQVLLAGESSSLIKVYQSIFLSCIRLGR